jgi:hypothetical protein
MADTKASAETDAAPPLRSDIVRLARGGGNRRTTLGEVRDLSETVAAGIVAAGTDQASATLLTATQNYVGTVAAGTGVRSGVPVAGNHLYVRNKGANDLFLYPAIGVAINDQAVNIPVIVPVNTMSHLTAESATEWSVVS